MWDASLVNPPRRSLPMLNRQARFNVALIVFTVIFVVAGVLAQVR